MTTVRTRVAPASRRFRNRALAVTSAVLAAGVTWTVAVPILGVAVIVRMAPGSSGVQTVGITAVLAVSLLASLLGWGLLAVLERRTDRSGAIWTIAAGAVLALSLTGPLTAAASTAAAGTLALLHLSVAIVLIPLLRRTAEPRR